MTQSRLSRPAPLLLIFTLTIIALAAPIASAFGQASGLQRAWEAAQEAGSYRFTADAEITLLPHARAALGGQQERRFDWRIDGDVAFPDQARMRMRAEGAAFRSAAVEVIHASGQTFVERDGELVLSDNPVSVAAPSMDMLAYLAGAVNESEEQLENGVTLVTFDIDGPRFAKHVAAELQEQMAGKTPAGFAFAPPELLNRATGKGQLWISADGLPLREVVELSMPAVNESFSAAVRIIADFRDFGGVGELPVPVPDGQGGWTVEAPDPGVASAASPAKTPGFPAISGAAQSVVRESSPMAAILLFIALLAALAFMGLRRRWRLTYGAVIGSVCLAMLAGPLMRSGEVVLFLNRQAEAAELGSDNLAALLGTDDAAREAKVVANINAQQANNNGNSSIDACGDGTPGVDTDQDGLSDFDEGCLGTDPYSEDTDGDTLSDLVELEGFDLGGQHWTGDPFSVDSNRDGIGDVEEWAAPEGTAASHDLDGDGVPNLWDDDDDGDGVADSVDLSPSSYSQYLDEFSLDTLGGGFDGYQYIEMQLQPQDSDHWRYTLATLDWPFDELGDMMDLDNSTDDIRLVPLLEVATDDKPNEELADRYSVIPAGYLYVPLIPEDNGGQITSFRAKIAYAPDELDNIQWDRARFIWAVQGTSDAYTLCSGSDQSASTCQIVQDESIISYYPETFRLTGLSVTKSQGFESMVLGTPVSPIEDAQLFQLAFGLNASFLSFQTLYGQGSDETALQEVESRLTSPNTAITLTWGVDNAGVAVQRAEYDHLDEGLALTGGELIPDFLTIHYPDSSYPAGQLCGDAQGNEFKCTSLLSAYEFDLGSYNLSDLGTGQVDASAMSVALNNVDLITQRGVKLTMYEENLLEEWQSVSPARMMEILQARYSAADLEDTLLALQQFYPDLTTGDLEFATNTVYAAWTSGSAWISAINSTSLGDLYSDPTETEGDATSTITELSVTSVRFLLDAPGLFEDLSGGIKEDWKITQSSSKLKKGAGTAMGITAATAVAGRIILGIAQAICGDEESGADCDDDALEGANYAINTLSLIDNIRQVAQGIKAVKTASNANQAIGAVSNASKLAKGAAVVGLVVDLALTWTLFGLTIANADGNPLVINVAIATAVVGTVFAVVLFVLALFVPVGTIISAILSILDVILSLATGGDYSLVQAITELFYSVVLLTTVDSINFLDFRISLSDEDRGAMVGNTYEIEDTFSGVIATVDNGGAKFDGRESDLDDSSIEASFEGVADASEALVQNTNGQPDCSVEETSYAYYKGCTQEVGVSAQPLVAKTNLEIQINRSIDYTIRYADCGFWGTVCAIFKDLDDTISIPDLDNDDEDDDEPIVLYFDIIPDDVSTLWTMSELIWSDRDFDGLLDSTEAASGADSTLWDTDGDGLSDKYELEGSDSAQDDDFRATTVNQLDSDGDGLTDGQELALATVPNDDGDSDDDGLLDGEELFHVDLADADDDGNTSEWLGGWAVTQVTLPNGRHPFLFTDPAIDDADQDGLADGQERGYGTSPFAFNDAPRLSLAVTPQLTGDRGQIGLYFAPGQAVTGTISLLSVGALPIDSTLTACLPAVLTNVVAGDLTGDQTVSPSPAPCAGNETGFAWAFTPANPLALGQSVSATITALVDPTLVTSTAAEATVSLPYDNETLTDTVHLVVDNDDPLPPTINAPQQGALLRGQTFVIAGVASDPTSWIDLVEVDTGGGFVAASGAEAWALDWTLPGDGPVTIRARARDPLGHQSAESSVNVTVDNTPPTVTLDQANSVVTGDRIVPLSGTSADATSGVARVQISIDRRPWTTVATAGGGWTYDWTPGGDSAQGSHTVAVRAFDLAGNESTTLQATVIVDRLPPTDQVISRHYNADDPPWVKAFEPTTLQGFANDAGRAPLPPRPSDLSGAVDAVSDATVWLSPQAFSDHNGGVKATWLGDVNGDGRADLGIGMPSADGGAGRVTVIHGRGGDFALPPDVEALSASPSSFVGQSGAGVGALMASAGDVDGDGFFDLLIGDPGQPRVFLAFGRPRDLGPNRLLDGPKAGAWTVLNLPDLPTGVASAGDVNGDGFDDLLVVAGGQAYLLANQQPNWPAEVTVVDDAAAVVPLPVGGVATGVGDVNGDQLDDFAASDGSSVYLFSGRTTFTEGAAISLDLTVDENNALAAFGGSAPVGQQVVALGDVNGDQLADLLYSAGGTPRLVLGRSGGGWGVSLDFNGYNPPANGFLAAPGDVNADGLDDILLGTSAGTAYLVLGAGSPNTNVEATLSHVAGAASAPYAAGSDLNCDLSSDLLLVPDQAGVTPLSAATMNFGNGDGISRSTLQMAQGTGERSGVRSVQAMLGDRGVLKTTDLEAVVMSTSHFVDDEAGCGGQSPCYGTIQDAVNAAVAGDSIVVLPGVYAPFSVDGKDNLAIAGVDADAVFVDADGSGYAVDIRNAKGVALRAMTLRNAQQAVQLTAAGVGGADNPGDVTQLAGLLIQDFTNAVSMDRPSTLSLRTSTLAGGDGSNPYIDVVGPADPNTAGSWGSALPNVPYGVDEGGGIAATAGNLYVMPGGEPGNLYANAGGTAASWTQLTSAPGILPNGSAVAGDVDDLYVMLGEQWWPLGSGVSASVSSKEMAVGAQNVYFISGRQRWDGSSYSTWGGQGVNSGSGIDEINASGTNLYALGSFDEVIQSNGDTLISEQIALWDSAAGQWVNLAGGLGTGNHGGEVVQAFDGSEDGAYIYALHNDNGLKRFDGNGFSTLADYQYYSQLGGWSSVNADAMDVNRWGDAFATGEFVGVYSPLGSSTVISATGIAKHPAGSDDAVALGDGLGMDANGNAQAADVIAASDAERGDVFVYREAGLDLNGDTAVETMLGWWDDSAGSWQAIGDMSLLAAGQQIHAIYPERDGVLVGGNFTAIGGVAANYVARWTASGGWEQLLGGVNNNVNVIAGWDNRAFLGGDFGQATRPSGSTVSAAYVVQISSEFYRYATATDSWQILNMDEERPLPVAAMTVGVNQFGTTVYVLSQDDGGFYLYGAYDDDWDPWSSAPTAGGVQVSAGEGTAMAQANGDVYALMGGNNTFHVFNAGSTTGGWFWTQLSDAPYTAGAGAGLAWDGDDAIFATFGGRGNRFARYNISTNTWDTLGDLPGGLSGVDAGGGLVRLGDMLYASLGGDSTTVLPFGPLGLSAEKLTLQDVAFVAPETAASARWLSSIFDGGAPGDFLVTGQNNRWVPALGWSPNPDDSAVANLTGNGFLSYADAAFVDPANGVFRVQPGSLLSAGYHQPPGGDVHVYVNRATCDRCDLPSGDPDRLTWGVDAFDSIQDAIRSRAPTVRVHPGRYPGAFQLVSGVQVTGAGADRTVVEPAAGGTPVLVRAEGIVGAGLAGLTLDGGGSAAGLRVEDDAKAVTVVRLVVQGATNGIRLLGANTDVEVFNLTFYGNNQGVHATACANLDVRNTIFLNQSGAALRWESCASQPLHTYNSFWDNTNNFVVDGVPVSQPGQGEIFGDPLLANPAGGDLRLLPFSPAIDAGTPSDPVPPGAGGAVDMGYAEFGAAAFYASAAYCSTCLNDGLIWQVDAFDKVQDALDAAQSELSMLSGPLNGTLFTVGVDQGTYAESLQVPSHVRLVGLGGENTTIDAGGAGSAIALNGVGDVEVANLRVTGASGPGISVVNASNAFTLTRLLINGNAGSGVKVETGSSGELSFNTVVGNSGAGLEVDGAGSWVAAENNIAAYNGAAGLRSTAGGLLLSDYNLLFGNSSDYGGVTAGGFDITGQDPAFADLTAYALTAASPAVDSADPHEVAPAGGGDVADRGYRELLAPPLLLLFGQQGANACSVGNSGVAAVEVGLTPVPDATQPLTGTLPGGWTQAILDTPGSTASYWSAEVTPGSEGLFRIYTRATDAIGNSEADEDPQEWFGGALVADGTPPVVSWVAPANGAVVAGAAVELVATAADFVDVGGDSVFAVSEIYFTVDGVPVPAAWVDDGWTAASGQPRTFRAWTTADAGNPTIQVVAVDRAGNVGQPQDRVITVSPGGTATIVLPAEGDYINSVDLLVLGQARFGSAGGNEGRVTVRVDNQPAVAVTLDDSAAAFTGWQADVTVPAAEGAHAVTASLDGSDVDTMSFILDTTPPALAVTSPAANSTVQQVATLEGTAGDGNGVLRVEVSLDGGASWVPATLNGNQWLYDWTTTPGLHNVSFPIRVRATDLAGNQSVINHVLVVNNAPPFGITPVSFDIPAGSHLDGPTNLQVTWTPPAAALGATEVYLVADQSPNTVPGPANLVGGSSAALFLSSPGPWYVHIAAQNSNGGSVEGHFGPWFVGSVGDSALACVDRTQTIVVDGLLDRRFGEWRNDQELLDGDERGPKPQQFYATWEGNAVYLGWQNAWWLLDGTMWAYLDVAAGGTDQMVNAGQTLPFQADIAVAVDGPLSGTLWRWTGSWQIEAPAGFDFANGESGGTEVRVPLPANLNGVSDLRLLAYAVDDDGSVWSTFPTANPLAGPWTSAYQWSEPCTVAVPSAGQPTVPGARLTMGSPQSRGGQWGPGQTLDYVLTVTNLEAQPLSGLRIELTSSSGLSLQNGMLDVPPVPPLGSVEVQAAGLLAANLTGIDAVAVQARLLAGQTSVDTASLGHLVDGEPPTVDLFLADGTPLRPGLTTLRGVADDGDGAGVGAVRLVVAGIGEIPVSGTRNWSAEIPVPPTGPLQLTIQASDIRGNTSAPLQVEVPVDGGPPQVAFDLPAAVIGDPFVIEGTSFDAESSVVRVEVQINGGIWQLANGPYAPDEEGQQAWAYVWSLPSIEGTVNQVRARAFDAAGNVTVTDLQEAISFTQPPVVAGPDLAVNEGDLVTFVGSFIVYGSDDPYYVRWEFGDGTPPLEITVTDPTDPAPMAPSTVYADNDTYTVTLTVAHDGYSFDDTLEVAVANVLPTVDAGPDQKVFEDDLVSLNPATFNELGTLDTHTATVDWGDGTPVEVAVVSENPFGPPGSTSGANGTVDLTHIYPDPGLFDVTVCVADDDQPDLPQCDAFTFAVMHGFLRYCSFSQHPSNGVSLSGKALLASCNLGSIGNIDLKTGSQVFGSVVSYEKDVNLLEQAIVYGNVTAGSDVSLELEATITGNATAVQDISLLQNAVIGGDATAGGTVTLEAGAVVSGTITQGAAVARPPAVTLVSISVTPGSTDVTVPKNGEVDLAPGAYGKLTIQDGGTLVLQAGQYSFAQFSVSKNGTLSFEGGDEGTVVMVEKSINLGQSAQVISTGGPAGILLLSAGNSISLGQDGTYMGTWIAPKGSVNLEADTTLIGGLYGDQVNIKGGAQLTAAPAFDLFISHFLQEPQLRER